MTYEIFALAFVLAVSFVSLIAAVRWLFRQQEAERDEDDVYGDIPANGAAYPALLPSVEDRANGIIARFPKTIEVLSDATDMNGCAK